MKMTKKTIAVLVAIVLAFSSCSILAYSILNDGKQRTVEYWWKFYDPEGNETTKVYPGEEITARLFMESDFVVAAHSIYFLYDKNLMTTPTELAYKPIASCDTELTSPTYRGGKYMTSIDGSDIKSQSLIADPYNYLPSNVFENYGGLFILASAGVANKFTGDWVYEWTFTVNSNPDSDSVFRAFTPVDVNLTSVNTQAANLFTRFAEDKAGKKYDYTEDGVQPDESQDWVEPNELQLISRSDSATLTLAESQGDETPADYTDVVFNGNTYNGNYLTAGEDQEVNWTVKNGTDTVWTFENDGETGDGHGSKLAFGSDFSNNAPSYTPDFGYTFNGWENDGAPIDSKIVDANRNTKVQIKGQAEGNNEITGYIEANDMTVTFYSLYGLSDDDLLDTDFYQDFDDAEDVIFNSTKKAEKKYCKNITVKYDETASPVRDLVDKSNDDWYFKGWAVLPQSNIDDEEVYVLSSSIPAYGTLAGVDLTEIPADQFNADNSINLFPLYVPNVSYTATYVWAGQGAVEAGSATAQLHEGDVILDKIPAEAPAADAIEGYELKWYADSAYGTLLADSDVMGAADATVAYGRFEPIEYTITLDYNGATVSGAPLENGSIGPKYFGDEIDAPALPAGAENGDLTFSGWQCEGVDVVFPYEVTGNATFTAVWKNIKTVTWKIDGSDEYTDYVEVGQAITVIDPADYVVLDEGKHFSDWTGLPAGNIMPNANIEISCTTENNVYNVTFANDPNFDVDNTAENEAAATTVTHGDQLSLPGAPANVPAGYTFGGWTDGDQVYTDGDIYEPADMDHGDTLELIPVWESIYVVNFYVNGVLMESLDESDGIIIGETIGEAGAPGWDQYDEEIDYPDGYEIIGWSTSVDADDNGVEADIVEPVDDMIMPAVDELNFYAVIKAKEYGSKKTVDFNHNEGNDPETIDKVEDQVFDSQIKGPAADPTRKGYAFKGWSEDPSATEADYTTATLPELTVDLDDDEVTFYAVWEALTISVEYYVDGELVNRYNVPFDEAYTVEGYSAEGIEDIVEWTVGTGAIAVGADYTFTEDDWDNKPVKFEATSEKIEYTATFDTDGGEFEDSAETGSRTYYAGDIITAPADPVKEGNVFIGWENGELIGTAMPANDTTFTALWNEKVFDITYTDGTTTQTLDDVPYSDIADTAPNPDDFETEGMHIEGWEIDDGEGGTVPYTPENVEKYADPTTGAITVTAVLAPNSYKITYVTDGTAVPEATYDFGDDVDTSVESTKDGYTFDGWTYDPALGAGDKMPASDVTATASFTARTVAVTYKYNDAVVTATGAEAEATFDTPYVIGSYSTEGYPAVTAWTLEGTSSTYAPGAEYTVTVDDLDNGIVFTATGAAQVYDVYYLLDAADDPADAFFKAEAAYGEAIPAPASDPTAADAPEKGMVFVDWDNATYNPGGEMPAEDVTFVAIWDYGQFDLTFKALLTKNHDLANAVVDKDLDPMNDVDAPEPILDYVPGTQDDIVKDGFTYEDIGEYALLEEGNYRVITAADEVRENLTVYVIFNVDTVTISFFNYTADDKPEGDYQTTPLTVVEIAKNGKLEATQYEGANKTYSRYDFAGWGLDAATTTVEDLTTKTFDANQNLYAKYTEKTTVTVTFFDYDGVQIGNPVDVEYDTAIAAANVPTVAHKKGYSFEGWYDGTDASANKVDPTTKTFTDPNTNLYARGTAVKLIPASTTSTAMIERRNAAGTGSTVETYNDTSALSFGEYEITAVEAFYDTYGDYSEDYDNFFVYGLALGISTKAQLDAYVTVSGDGYYTVEESVEDCIGTGSLITVYDSEDNVIEKFYVVIFGDINGDADILPVDATIAKNAAAGSVVLDKNYKRRAADVNQSADLEPADSTMIKNVAAGAGYTIDQKVGKYTKE